MGVAVTIATDNVRHFLPLVNKVEIADAKPWREISP